MERLSPQDIAMAAGLLKEGIPVAFPTETVYGLGARVFDPSAAEKIFHMKGRPSDNPLICHIGAMDQLELLAMDIPQEAFRLAAHFWPGPLTLVLKKQRAVPSCVTGGHETVAIRMPDHPIALELIRQVGEPLVAPSANRSGRPSSTTARHVLDDFKGMQGAVIDGGSCAGGVESTVLYLVGPQPLILRPGPLSKEAIAEVLQMEVGWGSGEGASPGTRYRHYAPAAKMSIVSSFEEALATQGSPFLMSTEPHPPFHHVTAPSLYALLRQADLEGHEEIVVVCGEWKDEALRDRLLRAAGAC
jgi:L-threonylcarbamoyladenylate synthase